MLNKQITAKRAWADLSERARLGYKFGFISCLGLLYKSGEISRAEVIEKMLEAGISPDDCARFKRHDSAFQPMAASRNQVRG
jgi:hypothetical protein